MDPETSTPRDLPGRYGRAVKDLERLLTAAQAMAVVAGGWAVWRHGYAGRVTEDVDIVVAQDKVDTLKQLAGVCGFDYFDPPTGRWPKLQHRETGIEVDILPELGIPGTTSRPAPMPIGHPSRYQAEDDSLGYISLNGLIELKLGAGRAKDIADLIELIKGNPKRLPEVQEYLASIHPNYLRQFQQLIVQAHEE